MASRIEELKLIARCIAVDDRSAFGQLVEMHQQDLRRYLTSLCGDSALADDLAQEAFVKAYTGIRSFKGVARFRTWLYSIAYREFIDWQRRQPPVSDGLDSAQAAVASSEESRIDASHDVSRALMALNPTERSIVLLFYLEDRPVKEVSAITGVPENTVKVYLSRSRSKMAEFLKKDMK